MIMATALSQAEGDDFLEILSRNLLLPPEGNGFRQYLSRFSVSPEGEVTDLEEVEITDNTSVALVFTNHDTGETWAETIQVTGMVDLGDQDMELVGTEYGSGLPIRITVEYPED